MARQTTQQLNIRSAFARERVRQIVAQTGMTATQVVEDALRGYVPPGGPQPVGRLVRKGRILVIAARPGAPVITQEQTDAAIEAARTRDLFIE